MNPTELENALLLHDSGELGEEESARLEEELLRDPALRARAEEIAVLRGAARVASELTTPGMPELTRERILREAGRGRVTPLPRLLAVAAGLVLAVGLWTHVDPGPAIPEGPGLAVVDVEAAVEEAAPLLLETEAFPELEALSEQLNRLVSFDPGRDLLAGDAEYWAEELLSLEDTI